MKNKILILALFLLIFAGLFLYKKQAIPTTEECGWEKNQSNAEMLGCLRNLKSNLLKEREMVFNNYISLVPAQIDPNFLILLQDVKEKTANWYKSTDSYRKAHCEARVANYADGSGYFEGIEMCEIELIRQDIHFLKDRIKELETYSDNFTPNSEAN